MLIAFFLQESDLQADANPFDVFKVRPLLKLKLSWSQEPTNGLVNRPKLYQQTNENGHKKDSTASKDRQTTSKSSNSSSDPKNGIVSFLIQLLYSPDVIVSSTCSSFNMRLTVCILLQLHVL